MGSIGWIPHGYRSELRGWLALGTIVTGSVFEKEVFHGCSSMLEAFGAGRWWARWLTSDGVLSCILGGQRGSVEMVTRQSEGGIGVEGEMQRSASPDAGVDVPFLHLYRPKSGLRSCGFGSKVWICSISRNVNRNYATGDVAAPCVEDKTCPVLIDCVQDRVLTWPSSP